ncbi:hypothetical protein BDW62DRAFT_215871 [Aspergillus aurantiobrunneus]
MKDPIAIVGMACRFPGEATDANKLWDLLMEARSTYSEVPPARFDQNAFHHPESKHNGTFYAKGGHFLAEDISRFDAAFFNISPAEAKAMDPQLRILLEVCYEAFENGGFTLDRLRGSNTSVYTAHYNRDYEKMLLRDPENIPFYTVTGTGEAMFSNRLSYFFDLKGPSFSLDTGCSGSMIALHNACASIWAGESQQSAVAATNLILDPVAMVAPSFMQFYSPDGRSYSFDSRACGYGRGEGAACLVLKPLADALRDGDNIRSIVRSCVANQDGRTPGITMPDCNAQKALIQRAYTAAGVDPRDTIYVEAHGSGTAAGDRIESMALGDILGSQRPRFDPLVVGSVKTNIGHLENASGLAALVKAILIIEHGCVPPSINFEKPSANINYNRWNLKVATEAQPLKHTESRQISVSSFGYGGTNCHTILDKAPSMQKTVFAPQTNPHRTGSESPSSWLRLSFNHSSTAPRLGFVFTGQGSQWYGMGRELLQTSTLFRDSILAAERHLLRLGARWKLTEELLNLPEMSSLDKAQVAQPACTAIQLALINLLFAWQIKPYAVVGHSSGEIAAAYACSAISFSDALHIAYSRGLCSAVLAGEGGIRGAMLAAGLSHTAAETYLKRIDQKYGSAKVACVNSPQSVTLSGDEAAIMQLHTLLQSDEVFVRRLPVDVAYHSHHMARVAQDYRNALESIGPPDTMSSALMFSSVEGHLIDTGSLDADYWVKNLVSPVLFSQAFEQFCGTFANGTDQSMLIEIGPHAGLKGPIKQCLAALQPPYTSFSYISALSRNESSRKTTLALAGELFTGGSDIDLDMVNFEGSPTRPTIIADLPPYPWDHSGPYWHESRLSRNYRNRRDPPHDLLGVVAPDSSILEPRWRKYIRLAEMPWLTGHRVQGRMIFPGAGYLCMAFEAGAWFSAQCGLNIEDIASIKLSDVSYIQPLIVPESDDAIETVFIMRPSGAYRGRNLAHRHEFMVYSCADGTNVVDHCRGFIAISPKGPNSAAPPSNWEVEPDNMSDIEAIKLYDDLRSQGIDYSESFAGLSSVRAGLGSSQTVVDASKAQQYPINQPGTQCLHPAALDACMQSALPAIMAEPSWGGPLVLSSVKEITLWSPSSSAHPTTQQQYTVNCRTSTSRQASSYSACFAIMPSTRDVQKMSISSLTFTKIQARGQSTTSQTGTTCQKIVNYVDPLFLSSTEIEGICYAPTDDASVAGQLSRYARACHILAKASLGQLRERDLAKLEPYQVEYMGWLRKIAAQSIAKQPEDDDDDTQFLEAVEEDGHVGRMICRIGKRLPQILKGEQQAISLMTEGGLLHALYSEDEGIQRCAVQAAQYARLLGLKRPTPRILEVGAGTGGATLPIIESLSTAKKRLFQHYDFTDISCGFFPKAREKFAQWKECMGFQTLNIEKHPEDQGFEPGTYDLMIAANVLHATSRIDRTMKHVRSLLQPGGSLLLIESTQPTAYRSFIFGTLPGWWLGSLERQRDHPLLAVDEWDSLLKNTGFEGVEACTHAYKAPREHIDSVIISHALPEERQAREDPPLLVLSERQLQGTEGDLGLQLADNMAHSLSIPTSSIVQLGDPEVDGRTCICLAGLEEQVLAACSKADFTGIQDTFKRAKEVLWVTQGAMDGCTNPASALAIGLLRVLRRENQADNEWLERDCRWFVPRIIEDDATTSALSGDTPSSVTLRNQSFKEANRPLRLVASPFRTIQDMHFADNVSFDSPLADDEVEIEVKATGVNFRDSLTILGAMDAPLGGESSGFVVDVGAQCRSRFQPGDRVYSCYVAAHANRVRAKASFTHLIPEALSFEDAATLPFIYGTAYHSLVSVARLQPGESVLIHAGAGGVGQAAITLAQHIGAVVFTSVGTEEKKQHLIERYGIPESHIFSSRNSEFVHGIQRVTKNAGVDVVLAAFGRFVDLGKIDALSHARLDMSVFTQPVSVTSVDLLALRDRKPQQTAELHLRVHELIEAGVCVPPPTAVYPVSQIEDAFRQIQAGKHMGKLVLSFSEDSVVKVAPPVSRQSRLKANASYLLIGGQGGLGREMCRWMANHGAKHLVVLSPSGATKPVIQTLIKDLAAVGTELRAIACDVGNSGQLLSALTVCQNELPPIQGVVYAAVSLRDAFARWRTTQGFPTRIIDLGIIQDAGYVFENPASTEHLQRSGIKAIPLDTLLALFQHCMYSPPEDPSSSQVAIGWSPEMAENIDNSLFSQLMSSKTGSPGSSGLQASPDELLEAARHSTRPRTEVLAQLETTICQYVSRVLGVPIEDVDPLQSMSRHGGDLLVLAEFRNWLQKGVGAPLAMGKDLGQLPLRELARMAAESVRKEPVSTATPRTSTATETDIPLQSQRLVKQSPSAELPSLPLPSLEETVERYLQTVRPLVSDSEFAATSLKAKEFRHPTDPASRLQSKLQAKKDDPKIRNWLDGIYAEVRYLRDRRPLVPFSSYFASNKTHGLDSSDQGSPAVRAATISWSAFRFKMQYEQGDLPCETVNEEPVCMDGYR